MSASENVLGGILIGGRDAYWRVADVLRPEDFANHRHASLFRICGEMAQSSSGFDFLIVGDEAQRQGVMDAADVTQIARNTGSAANIRAYAERVKQDALERRVRAICAEGAKTGDVATVQASLAALLSAQPAHAIHARDVLSRMWANVMERYTAGDALAGLETGIPLLDEYTGGLQPSRVYGIGARAKMGKTILAMNIAANVASPPTDATGEFVRKPRHVAAWSLEMSDEELMQRMASAKAGTQSVLLQRPKLLDREDTAMGSLNAAIKSLREAPLRISDKTDVSIEQIESQARQMHAGGELDLLVIDYLGLLRMPKMDRHDLSVAHCTRRVKIIAKELRIPVILVFQLNRGSENGQQVRPPRPSDARDSGAIEQDLDAMLLLHRPSYYDKNAPKGLRLDLAIQRNGPTGLIHMHDELDCCRFTGGHSEWTDATQPGGGRDDDL